MIRNSSTVKSEAHFSDDGLHRYLLKRVWDESKPNALIIMLNPSYAGEVKCDYSSMRALNYLVDKGYGSMTIVNLFSWIETESDNLPEYSERYDADTDKHTSESIKLADDIYIAWGSNKDRKIRIKQVITLIEKHKIDKTKIYRLTDENDSNTHISRLGKGIVKKSMELSEILK